MKKKIPNYESAYAIRAYRGDYLTRKEMVLRALQDSMNRSCDDTIEEYSERGIPLLPLIVHYDYLEKFVAKDLAKIVRERKTVHSEDR